MAPDFREGDRLVLMPGAEAHSGSLAVAKFRDDGVIFRRMETAGERVRLVAINDKYPTTDHAREEFAWIYPVWGGWRQVWR